MLGQTLFSWFRSWKDNAFRALSTVNWHGFWSNPSLSRVKSISIERAQEIKSWWNRFWEITRNRSATYTDCQSDTSDRGHIRYAEFKAGLNF